LLEPLKNLVKFKFISLQIGIVLLLTLLATLLSFLIRHLGFTEANIVIVYILSVLLASRYTRGFIYRNSANPSIKKAFV